MLQGVSLAQPATDTTSADVLESQNLFDPSGQATIGPRPYSSFAERLLSPVSKIAIKVAGENLLADGVTGTDVSVELQDAKGQLLDTTLEATLEVSGGARIVLPGQRPDDFGLNTPAALKPVTSVQVVKGQLHFQLIAPYKPDAVTLQVTVRGKVEKRLVRYVPDLREMVAVGLVEGRLRSDKFNPNTIVPVRENDGFDNELRGFTRDFNGGAGSLGARAALYLKGKIKGEYLLTMRYDSDKVTTPQLFSTIDPTGYYPVYGDSSLRGVDAQSSGKMYVRIDKHLSNLVFGDITTAESNPARQLSQYSRTFNGIKGHYEEGRVVADSFVAQQSFTQVIDEFSGRGVSGPYSVSRSNGVTGTEKIEILVRDRNRPSVILKSTALTRSSDYEFEPFSGQILFKSPVPSFDDQQNPVSIRVTYEVDQGGPKFIIAGGDVRLRLSDKLTLGASAAKDKNPVLPYEVQGANLQLNLSKSTQIVAELARTRGIIDGSSTGYTVTSGNSVVAGSGVETTGMAARAELRHSADDWRLRAYVAKSDENFYNPSGGMAAGRTEYGSATGYQFSKNLSGNAEYIHSADALAGSKSDAVSAGLDLKISDKLTLGAGARHVRQSAISLVSPTGYTCTTSNGTVVTTSTGYYAGYGISQTGNQQIDPTTGLPMTCTPLAANSTPVADLDTSSLYVRGSYRVSKTVGLSGEAQREMGASGTTLYRLGADWQAAEKTRLYARYERARTYGGAYGLGVGDTGGNLSFGLDTQYLQEYMPGATAYSEYRLRDGASGRDMQAAMGLRNSWNLVQGLKLQTNLERLTATSGRSLSAGVGLEYTADPLWKASGRLELRHGDAADNWLLTLNVARKLDRNWTLVARDYINLSQTKPVTDASTGLSSSTPTTRQARFQLGAAYRPVDNNRFDALTLYERKDNHNPAAGTDSLTDIFTLRANYHPSRPWFVSGRLAVKRVNELLLGSVNSSYAAALFGGRITYDLSNRWSLGLIETALVGQGGSLQYAHGVEVGYTLVDNLLVTLGYNWRGFRDIDLAGSNYTNRGWVLDMRYKFDETLFGGSDAQVNKTLAPEPGKP